MTTRRTKTLGKPDFSTMKRPEFDAAKAAGEFDASGGKLPMLTVDGAQIGQSKAIERFLAKQLGLAGSSDVEAAQVDAVGETVRDIKENYQKAKGDDATKEKFFTEDLPAQLAQLEKSLPTAYKIEDNPWQQGMDCYSDFLIGRNISYADVVVFNFLTSSKGFFDDAAKAKAAYSDCTRISASMDAVAKNADIQAYLAKRPDTIM